MNGVIPHEKYQNDNFNSLNPRQRVTIVTNISVLELKHYVLGCILNDESKRLSH